MNKTTRDKGAIAEDIACNYLLAQGLELLTRNYRTSVGEIDLIMKDGEVTVFVEVRARKNNCIYNVLESIDLRKRNHIIRTSEHYLQRHRQTNKAACRFDIVLVTGELDRTVINWLTGAFEA